MKPTRACPHNAGMLALWLYLTEEITMCSIIGYCGTCADIESFRSGFAQTISRGPDDTRIVDTGKGLLGFHRLAIMGLTPEGMQPFSLAGSYVVCNGEIYGFEKIKKAALCQIYICKRFGL